MRVWCCGVGCGLWHRWCSGCCLCVWAGLLCAPVGGGPPARSPHASLRLGVIDLEARPGPAAAHGHRTLAWPTNLFGALHTSGAWCAVCGGASSRCPAGPAAASYRSGRVVCVLPGLVLCGIRGACAEHEEARDCCRQNERADADVHKGAGCLSDEESLKQPGQQEETEEAPHASCCACHQLL